MLLSDLLDLPEGSLDRFAALSTHGRLLVAVQVLDPSEKTFPFSGPLRLRAAEGDLLVETDADAVRAGYLEALARRTKEWEQRLLSVGGRLLVSTSADDPVQLVRETLAAVSS